MQLDGPPTDKTVMEASGHFTLNPRSLTTGTSRRVITNTGNQTVRPGDVVAFVGPKGSERKTSLAEALRAKCSETALYYPEPVTQKKKCKRKRRVQLRSRRPRGS